MFRFNEGDIADDAAAYLLAIKESVRRVFHFIETASWFSVSHSSIFLRRVLKTSVAEKADMECVLLTHLLENFTYDSFVLK